MLYKNRPGLVLSIREKFELQLDNARLSVRPKDVVLLHPGPLKSLLELPGAGGPPLAGDIETAWEILAGGETNINEMAELIYGKYTPASAWAAWQVVMEGLYFRGEDPTSITASTQEEVRKRLETRQMQQYEEIRWQGFVERILQRKWATEDQAYLQEVEDLALGRRAGSRVLNTLGREERPESAHAFLLEVGYWKETTNPYPSRLGLSLEFPTSDLPELLDENRRDLTHLESYAIDDPGSQDPDDAVSLEGDWKVWVHVADAAALVQPDSPADLEARSRGTNLYMPEITVPMLPPAAVQRLGIGLAQISPALSFGIELSEEGVIEDVEVVPSWIQAQRLSYDEAATRLNQPVLFRLYEIALLYMERRNRAGAVSIDLPEVKLKVEAGKVSFIRVPDLPSRTLVKEAMVMAGEAAAMFALRHAIPVPFAAQPPSSYPETISQLPDRADLAGMYALRRIQTRGRVSSHPAPHTGLGLPHYTRVTSPLRRYLDLAAHQQLRLFLQGQPPMSEMEMVTRVGESEAITGSAVRAESLSRRHWTLVHFLQNPDWAGEGVVVEKRGSQVRLILPELAFETPASVRGDPPLNARLLVTIQHVNLPELDVSVRAQLGFFGDSG